VLRITQVESNESSLEMYLEGQLSGPWVAELQQLCEAALGRNRRLRLELSGVSFMDAQGISLIRSLSARVSVENCTPFVSGQLSRETQEGA
jgi:anti-anti-sigma regulatory factor